jgi:hypothetical protein
VLKPTFIARYHHSLSSLSLPRFLRFLVRIDTATEQAPFPRAALSLVIARSLILREIDED